MRRIVRGSTRSSEVINNRSRPCTAPSWTGEFIPHEMRFHVSQSYIDNRRGGLPSESEIEDFYMTLTRPSLLLQLRSVKNAEFWKEFYATYSPILQEYAQAYGRCHDDQYDIVQTVWLTLCRLMPSFQYEPRRGKFRHLLRRIVRNTAIDWGRRQKTSRSSSLELEQVPDSGIDAVCRTEESADRWNMLQKCLNDVRSRSTLHAWCCFDRHVLQRQSATAVGSDLGLSANAVYIHSSRILDRVRQSLRAMGKEQLDD